MTATPADYTWFGERFPELAAAYCVTLVKGLTPEEVLRRLNARDFATLGGVAALLEPAYTAWDSYGGAELFVGVTPVDGWALLVEPNGFLGTTDEAIGALSRGTTLVSHYDSANGVNHFFWVEDGTVRLHFEPLFPNRRNGMDPDGLLDLMHDIGFEFDEDSDFDRCTEASFVLAEHLTHVRLTPELLEFATFTCGIAPNPG